MAIKPRGAGTGRCVSGGCLGRQALGFGARGIRTRDSSGWAGWRPAAAGAHSPQARRRTIRPPPPPIRLSPLTFHLSPSRSGNGTSGRSQAPGSGSETSPGTKRRLGTRFPSSMVGTPPPSPSPTSSGRLSNWRRTRISKRIPRIPTRSIAIGMRRALERVCREASRLGVAQRKPSGRSGFRTRAVSRAGVSSLAHRRLVANENGI